MTGFGVQDHIFEGLNTNCLSEQVFPNWGVALSKNENVQLQFSQLFTHKLWYLRHNDHNM